MKRKLTNEEVDLLYNIIFNSSKEPKWLIGYILIENYQTEKEKVCETPKHEKQKIKAYAVMALTDENRIYETIVQMVCKECWRHFDDDMGNPQWNLNERMSKI